MAADYYSLLGLQRGASDAEIKKAYRRMAMKYHPDQNKGNKDAEAKFKEIATAYEVLKDAKKRALYDQVGHDAFESHMSGGGGGGGPHPGHHGFEFNFGGGGAGGFEDLFEELLGRSRGGGGRGRGARAAEQGRGSDLRFDMSLSLEEAFAGLQTDITIPTWVTCTNCKGQGSQDGAAPTACHACGGQGTVTSQQGLFMFERTCPSCSGSGHTIANPCKTCSAAGRVRQRKKIRVNIPAGIESGARVRLTGEGEAGMRQAPAGDLYIFVALKPHAFFKRDGRDLYCEVTLSMAKAALGGSIEVPTMEGGRVRVTIPEGTQSGSKFRVRLKGMPMLKSSLRGDLYVTVTVETPVHLSTAQKEVLRTFEKESDAAKVQPKTSKFWKNLGSLFG